MKKLILVLLIIPSYYQLQAQSETALAKAAVLDYIEGTANGQIQRIKNAFEESAEICGVNDDQSMRCTPIEKYIGFFKEGQKVNRVGHVVSLQVINNAANAVVEIDMPDRKRLYTDFLLLLKINGKWKIINKSYTFVNY